jgi:DNA sulfur modification protein DndB
VFTLNSVYNATKELLGKATKKSLMTSQERKLVTEFWNEVYNNMKEWQSIVNGNITPYEVREKYVHVYGIVLHALGKAGHELIQKYPDTWKSKLKVLSRIDWSRNNVKIWRGRMLVGNKISKSRTSISLTTNYIKNILGLKLNNEESILEKKLQ